MYIYMIRSDFIDRTKTHFGEQCDPCFNRMQFKRPDPAVFGKEKIKQPGTFFRLARQEVINRVAPAGMGLVFIKELMMAFWAGPHGIK